MRRLQAPALAERAQQTRLDLDYLRHADGRDQLYNFVIPISVET